MMRSIPIEHIEVAHALELEHTAQGGTIFRRLPDWTRAQIPDVAFDLTSTMPTGVRLRLTTDTQAVEVDVMLTMLEIDGRPAKPAVFDLVIDDRLVSSADTLNGTRILVESATRAISFLPGEPTTIRLDTGAITPRTMEIWLPQDVVVEVRDLRVDDTATVEKPAGTRRRRWVHYGSSISHCAEADHPTGTWPAVAARLAGVDLHSLAIAGQCMLDPFVARTIRDVQADLISLKVGINIVNGDTMRERTFGPALNGFLDTVREEHPTTTLAVITPIICPIHERHPGPTAFNYRDKAFEAVDRPTALAEGALSLQRIREMIAAIVGARRDRGDSNLHLIDGLELFGEADVADLPDRLHPNAAGYVRMGQRFHEIVFNNGGPFVADA
jgi:lysophospholipase L1-like esterase